jgi:hypothetical protein
MSSSQMSNVMEGRPMRGRKAFLIVFALWCAGASAARAEEFSAKNWPMWLTSEPEALRSPSPPADAKEELRQLKELASHRTAEDLDLIAWWDVGGPVYRWNQIANDELLDHGVTALMAARHLALLHAAMQDAVVVAWDSKVAYGRPRPSQLDATLAATCAVEPLLSIRLRRRHHGSGRGACLRFS